ncbi:MAG: hypothetical protein ACLQPD_36155 [Desulfomonilaceae bacterium]
MILREKRLQFDFRGCIHAEKFDENPAVPNVMKKVDFLVEEQDRILLVELKDISDTATTRTNRENFIRNLKSKNLIHQTLVPKCRDTWTFLHLMDLDDKPILYIVVITLYENDPRPAVFGGLMSELSKRLRKEATKAWQRRYVSRCVILNLNGWNKSFPRYRAQRI